MIVFYYLGLVYTSFFVLLYIILGFYNEELFIALLFLVIFIVQIRSYHRHRNAQIYLRNKQIYDRNKMYNEDHSSLFDE